MSGYLERKRYGALYGLVRWFRQQFGADRRRDVGGRIYLEPKFPIDFFQVKCCLDICCGAGRWTDVGYIEGLQAFPLPYFWLVIPTVTGIEGSAVAIFPSSMFPIRSSRVVLR